MHAERGWSAAIAEASARSADLDAQAAVAQHLKVLRESDFARVRAEAQRRLYSLDPTGLQAVDAWVGQFRNFWEPKFDALATEIARGKRARRNASTLGGLEEGFEKKVS